MIAGAYAAVIRIGYGGLGGSTNLSDLFPWGLWIGFDVLRGVGLAAGGFTLAATVHIFNLKRYEPIVRPATLTAFLGYLPVILALLLRTDGGPLIHNASEQETTLLRLNLPQVPPLPRSTPALSRPVAHKFPRGASFRINRLAR
jgi:hypothetical protein